MSPEQRVVHIAIVILALVNATPGLSQAKRSGESTVEVLGGGELESDPRLAAPVNVKVEGAEIGAILDGVGARMGVPLAVGSALARRRYSGLSTRRPLARFMLALARTSNMSWRRAAAGGGYELFQTDDQRRAEAGEVAESERREAVRRDQLKSRIRAALRESLRSGDPRTRALVDVLAGLGPDQIESALDAAIEPPDFISATDQSHFFSHFFYAEPFSSLGADEKVAIRSLLVAEQYSPSAGGQAVDVGAADVGLISAMGGLRLGVTDPSGEDLWVSPTVHIGESSTMDLQAQENDFDPSVERLLRSDALVDLSRMPDAQRRAQVRFGPSLSHRSLSEFLIAIAEQCGFSVSCDDFLNSSRTTYSGILADEPAVSAETALRQVAKTFGHRMVYSAGCLFVDTITRGLDQRLEPPAEVSARLAELSSGVPYTGFPDLLLLAGCSKRQLANIEAKYPTPQRVLGVIVQAARYYSILHFYASLSMGQRSMAESSTGLPYSEMDRPQRLQFDYLTHVGLRSSARMSSIRPASLYATKGTLKLASGRERPTMTFVLTGIRGSGIVHRYDIR